MKRPCRRAGGVMPAPPIPRLLRHRVGAFVVAMLVVAMGTVFWPAAPAAAAPPLQDQCSTQRWQDPSQWQECVGKLKELSSDEVQCVTAPTPEPPDSGRAGWFATKPDVPPTRVDGKFTSHGYGGYDFTTYDIGCVPTVMNPASNSENSAPTGHYMFPIVISAAPEAVCETA